MKKYITGSGTKIEVVTIEKEIDHTIWYVDEKGRGQSCRKKSTYSQVWDSFQEAKDYLLSQENKHLEKLNNWTLNSVERINIICGLSEN